jgi:hypothetical protein
VEEKRRTNNYKKKQESGIPSKEEGYVQQYQTRIKTNASSWFRDMTGDIMSAVVRLVDRSLGVQENPKERPQALLVANGSINIIIIRIFVLNSISFKNL